MRQNSSMAEFMLSIYSVKLTVKFPCRMSLHQDGKPITTEVQSVNNVFTFNQDVTIKIDPKNQMQISAYLSTGKGGSILAGLISLPISGLVSKEGERFSVPLQKCIDTASIAQLKVNHAWVPLDRPNANMTRSSAGGVFIKSSSPNMKSKFKTQNDQVETRSQIQANTPRKISTITVGNNMLLKQRQLVEPKRYGFDSNNNREVGNVRISYKTDFPDPFEDDIRQTKTIGGHGQKYRRQKDKQRMERLAAKKIADETQNNLKMDVMKYKMKGEQLQKSVNQKNKTIKQLKDQILEHERKNIQRAYIQEELVSKQNQIKILQDRIANLNGENINLRQTIAQNLKSISELKQNIRFDILKNKEDYQKKQQVLRNQLTQCKSKIVELEVDTSNKLTQLLRAKKYIEDLEAAAEQKIFQHDRIIQDLKKQQSNSLKEVAKKVTECEAKIEQLLKELSNKTTQISKLNQIIIKLQQGGRQLEEKTQTLEIEKTQLQAFKADFQTLTKKYAKLQETLRDQQRNSKKIFQTKNKQIADNQELSNKNIKNLESKLATAGDKMKQQKNKIQQLQNLLSASKNEQQKLKKQIQKSQRFSQQLQTKLQSYQKQLRSHENRFQNLQKQLGEKSSSSTHMQSLYKIQLQHSKESVFTLTRDYDELSNKYSVTKQTMQMLRNEKTKLQNKIQLNQQNINRLNQYIKEKKSQFDGKQNEYKQNIKNLNKVIKTWQQNDKTKQKQINGWEIKDLTSRNKIDKLEKSLQEANGKIDKFEKVTIVKLLEQKDKLGIQLQNTKIKLVQTVQQNKFITNERIKLQSQTNKNNKINTVLNEQKISNMNQLNKLKNTIARCQKNEQKLINELKSSNDENKRLTIKIQSLQKQLAKNRQILGQTMGSIMNMKKGMKQSLTIGQSPNMTKRTTTQGIRKRQTIIDNLTSSRVVASYNASSFGMTSDIKKISQILQNTSKQQQNTIILQQETINHYKDSIDKLQKQIATISFTSQANQVKLQQTIDHVTMELEAAHQRILTLTNNYQDKVSKLQTQINKKQKDIKLHKSTIGSLKYQLETLKKKLQILCEEGDMKEHKSGQKMSQLLNQLNFLENNIKNLENDKRSLETKLYSTQQDLSHERQERTRKQKFIAELTQKWTILRVEHEDLSKLKKDNLEQLLALREQLQALKESNEKTLQLLKTQEKNNKRLQDFINDLIKQKQNIVKIQLESSSKAIQMQGTVLQMKNLLDNKDQQLKQKQQQILQNKNNIKSMQSQIKNFQNELKQCNSKINTLNNKIQEKDKKISDTQNQIKQMTTQHLTIVNKNNQYMKLMKQQYQILRKRSQNMQQQKDSKIFLLQKHAIQLESQIQSINNELIQKQQLIFFQKQRASLSESTINDMKKGQSQISLMMNKYEAEINELNQELTHKQETLYEYSGRIYHLEQKLQAKQAEMSIREEKVDIDWQCRHDQICEEYEHKIEVLEKDKKYLKDKLDFMEQEKIKLVNDRQILVEQHEKDMGNIKAREKQLEQEKLHQVNQRNKEIEGLKNEVAFLSNQVKNSNIEVKKKENQIIAKDQVIKKLEIRIHQNDRGSGSLKKQYEQEINNLKKNQNLVKGIKEEMKNAQWVAEREVKKITQIFIQRVVNSFPEGKQKLVEPIRAMESSMAAAINFKL